MFQQNLAKNIINSSFLYGSRLVIPFLTYTYLLRKFSPDSYGLIIYFQSINLFFSYLINYGFEIYLTKVVADQIHNKTLIGRLFNQSFIIKLALFLISIPLILIISLLTGEVDSYPYLFVLIYLVNIKEVFNPRWLFWGYENFKYPSIIDFAYYKTTLIITVCLMNISSHIYLIPLAQIFGSISSIIFTLYFLKKFDIKFDFNQKIKSILKLFKKSFNFFASRNSAIFIENAPRIFIGRFVGFETLTLFDVSYKIIGLSKTPNLILDNVLYPRSVKLNDKKFVKNWLKIKICLAIVIAFFVYVFSDELIYLVIGYSNIEISNFISYLLFILILTAASYFIGSSILLAKNLNNWYNNSVNISAIILLCMLILILISNQLNVEIIIISLVITEIVILSLRIYPLLKSKLYD